MLEGVAKLQQYIEHQRANTEKHLTLQQQNRLHLKLMRFRNMFKHMHKGIHFEIVSKCLGLPVPNKQRNIVVNVIVTRYSKMTERFESIVAEIQLWFKPMHDR